MFKIYTGMLLNHSEVVYTLFKLSDMILAHIILILTLLIQVNHVN